MTNDVPQPGTLLDDTDGFESLPVGSVVRDTRADRVVIKAQDGSWADWYGGPAVAPQHGTYRTNQLHVNRYVVESVGEATATETLAQYQWRFRNNALSGAQEHSIGMAPVHEALNTLGLTLDYFPPGPGVPINLHDDVPNGTVVYVGSPETPATLGVFVRYGRSWQYVFGQVMNARYTMTVAAMPGHEKTPDWWTRPPTGHEADLIARAKARFYRVGKKVRARTSWCGAYEQVIARVGVTEAAVRGISGTIVGDAPNQVETAELPEGSLLGWNDFSDPVRWAVYRRQDSAQNQTRTMRVAGFRGDGSPLANWRAGARVIWMPGDGNDWTWTIPGDLTYHFLRSCPQDLRFVTADDGDEHTNRLSPDDFDGCTIVVTGMEIPA